MATLDSFDNMLAAASSKGMLTRFFHDRIIGATTAATSTSGRINVQRFPNPFTIPSVGTGVTGCYATVLDMITEDGLTMMVSGLEYSLGTLTVSGNSFAAGVTMPTKTVAGSSVTTATMEPILVVTTTLSSAVTPTVTITYTDQDGNTGQTATLTLPSNPGINTGFRIAPYLAAGDTGIRAVTNMSIDNGSAGALAVYGLLHMNTAISGSNAGSGFSSPIELPINMYLMEAGEKLAFYRFGANGTCSLWATLSAVASI